MSEAPRPEEQRSVRSTIARNTLFNAFGRFWEAGLTLVLTWYIVDRLETSGWGLWSLVAVFAGYAALLDFGIGSGFSKFIAQYWAKEDQEKIAAVVVTGIAFYALLGLLLLLIGWPAIHYGSAALMTPEAGEVPAHFAARLAEMRFLFYGALVLYIANSCLAPFAAVPMGLQRMGIANLLSIAASLIKTVATVFFLESGCGVPGLLYANAVVTLFLGGAGLIIVCHLVPGFRLAPGGLQLAVFRDLFAFGWRTQVARFSNLINFQTDRVIIAWLYTDLGLVGLYRLGEELAGKMRQAPGLLVTALTPAASDLDARDREETLRRMYLVSTKYMAALAVPLAVYVMVSAPVLMHAWMGDRAGLDIAALTLRILAVGYLLNLIPGPGVSIALGKGRADIPMIAGLISTGANVVLTVVLGLTLGFYGIPAATVIAMGLSTLWFLGVMGALMQTGLWTLFHKSLLWPLLASLPGGLLIGLLPLVMHPGPGHGANLLAAFGGAIAFAALYGLVLIFSPFLDAFDIAFLGETLRLQRAPGFAWLRRRVEGHA